MEIITSHKNKVINLNKVNRFYDVKITGYDRVAAFTADRLHHQLHRCVRSTSTTDKNLERNLPVIMPARNAASSPQSCTAWSKGRIKHGLVEAIGGRTL